MSSYRFHFHDRLGRLVDRHEQHCRDDEAALGIARGLNVSHDIEVWLGPRQVARIPKRADKAAAGPANEDAVPPSAPDKIAHG